MTIKEIKSQKAPQPVGCYSQAIEAGNLIFCSGQIGIDPETGKLLEGIEKQTEQVLKNLKAVLEAGNSSLDRVVKTTIYLTNIQDFQKVNEIYSKFFGSQKPARATVEVKSLPKGALIEIEAIALK